MEKGSVYNRIKAIADIFYGNESKMMEEIGFKQSTYATAKNRGSDVSMDLVRKIIEAKKIIDSGKVVDGNWLITGQGSMFLPSYTDGYDNSSVFEINVDEELYKTNTPEILTNKFGNRFFLYPNGKTEIEVPHIPFKAHASYVESYFDENYTNFDKVKFDVDKVGSGFYVAFTTDGDSMDTGNNNASDIHSGSVLLTRQIKRELWRDLHSTENGQIYFAKQGIWHKDFKGYDAGTGKMLLGSRNANNKDFTVDINDLYQIFNVIKIKKQ